MQNYYFMCEIRSHSYKKRAQTCIEAVMRVTRAMYGSTEGPHLVLHI